MQNLTPVPHIRQAMPATTARLYFNAGTFGPMPLFALHAMQEHLHSQWEEGRLGTAAFEATTAIYEGTRQRVARLLNANVDEIALTDNTGEGLNIISYGFQWQAGDEVITTNHEHISALAPLYQLRDRYGIVLRVADLGPQAEQPAADVIAPLINEHTRLIVLSHVAWTTGARIDIDAVGQMAHARGVPVLVDGAQSAGAISIDVRTLDVDFYAIPMQKWLCGPDGTGALYVRRSSLDLIQPTYIGYWSIKHEEGVTWELNDNAQRFELGGRQTAAIAGQSAVLQWLEEAIGYQWIFERIASLHRYAYQALQMIPGLTLLTPQPGSSGLIAFTLAGQDDVAVVNTLRDKHNISLRNIPETHALRISTGFYNTEEEIDTLVKALQDL